MQVINVCIRVRNRRAEFIFQRFFLVRRFNVTNECGTEYRLACSHWLESNLATSEHGLRKPFLQSIRGAIDMQCSGAGLDGTLIEHDAIRFDTLYPTAADDVFYPPQLLKFGFRHRGAAIHGGPHVLVKAQQKAFGLDTREEIGNRSRIGDRFKIVADKTANRLSKHLACLDEVTAIGV
jgi:hypothetical protein